MPDRIRETALVIDDERGPRDSLRMILSQSFHVRTASSALEALEILGGEDVALATLDLAMPGMDGQDLMRRMHTEFPRTEIIVITGCGSVESAAESVRFGICDYIEKPFDIVKVGSAVGRAMQRRRASDGMTSFLVELGNVVGREQEISAILQEVERSGRMRGRVQKLLSDASRQDAARAEEEELRALDFLEVLAETIETKDHYMRGHARRVSFYAGLLAERAGVVGEELERVRIGAFLHDLGKVGVPTDLLVREGALDPTERRIVEQHPVIGARLVRPLALPFDLGHAIRHHHEWWDGTGYPDGLSGEEIPLAARIVSIADAFDAMSCDRPYRDALRREVVIGGLTRFAGTQFDPELAKEFVALLESHAGEVDVTLLAEAAPESAT